MVDALASGASGIYPVEVQVLSSAPTKTPHKCGVFFVGNMVEDLNR